LLEKWIFKEKFNLFVFYIFQKRLVNIAKLKKNKCIIYENINSGFDEIETLIFINILVSFINKYIKNYIVSLKKKE
jgi:hypothetical protein